MSHCQMCGAEMGHVQGIHSSSCQVGTAITLLECKETELQSALLKLHSIELVLDDFTGGKISDLVAVARIGKAIQYGSSAGGKPGKE